MIIVGRWWSVVPTVHRKKTMQHANTYTTIAVDNILPDNYPLYYEIIPLQIKNCNVPKGNKTRDRKVLWWGKNGICLGLPKEKSI